MPNEVAISPGAYVADGVVVRAGVVIGPNAVVLAATDPDGPPTTVHSQAVIGANATILPGVQIGQQARIGPGSVVTRSVPPLAVVEGNPARIVAYVDSAAPGVDRSQVQPVSRTAQDSLVRGVTIREFTTVIDIRGSLSAAEMGRDIPFQPARFFLVYDVPSTETRGAHAHRRCEQLLVAARGYLSVVADDGDTRQEFLLDSPSLGLHLPAMTWGIQYKCSADAVLLVLASDPYDAADYIRDYAEFVTLAREARRG